MAKDPSFKMPKTLAACADLLYTTREARYALKKQVEALEANETELREYIIQNLPKSNATGIAGKVARVTVSNKIVAQVADWEKLYEFIVKSYKKNPGVFSLLQRRLGEKTAKEMLDAGKAPPGVKAIEVPVVSLNKV